MNPQFIIGLALFFYCLTKIYCQNVATWPYSLQDPSVQRAVAGSTAANANLEDYNPFDPKQTQTKSGGDAPAVMKPTQDAPPPYTPSGQQQITSADFQVNPQLALFSG